PFPEAAVVEALRGRKNVIVIERTDEPLSGDNPLMRDVRTAMSKALGRHISGVDDGRPKIAPDELPRLFGATYGLGSRDFRPEGILGAYEFVNGKGNRKDGATAADGTSYFTIGIDHPYAVESEETPSCLPDGAIAIRFHSIGGWGMITTGKNLGAIIGAFGQDLSERRARETGNAELEDVLNISANPKYGSEKKGAPTAYFLAVAPERIRVNCDLKHVDVVLCCDPKAFTHTDPIAGLKPGGALVWESDQSPTEAWKRIPPNKRRELLDKNIRVFVLPGFDIANTLAHRKDLQMRMQGNAFLGAFFAVSSFLQDYTISTERFREVVLKQYQTKFGRFGPNVVDANMQVMQAGFDRIQMVTVGAVDAPDLSGMRGNPIAPRCGDGGGDCDPGGDSQRSNIFNLNYFDSEFRAGLGYHQPASALAAVGVVASAAGATASKYVARRETPEYIAENCTQCMDCIAVCPDTALPNTAQDIGAVLSAAIEGYVVDASDQAGLLAAVPTLETSARAAMNAAVAAKEPRPFHDVVRADLQS
ncbi:MAG: 2-oxoacid:acceptor oxidoreductase family protein, partial [Myxococcota bacterium]|nr:2-oxoacid:acceptor oxidoreductase family protein [Myxococcota bacterium]